MDSTIMIIMAGWLRPRQPLLQRLYLGILFFCVYLAKIQRRRVLLRSIRSKLVRYRHATKKALSSSTFFCANTLPIVCVLSDQFYAAHQPTREDTPD